MYTLRVLGGLVLEDQSGPLTGRFAQKHRLALLALIAMAPARVLSRDKLVGYLWPERGTEEARHLLSVALHAVRKLPGEDLLVASGDGLAASDALVTDVAAFEQAVARGAFGEAVEKYAGPFLDGFFLSKSAEFERWVDAERDRLAHRHRQALESLARSRMAESDAPGAAAVWRQLASLEPFNSRIAGNLMDALAAAGDRAGALAHYRIHVAALEEEFGVEPEQDLVALAETIRTSPPVGSRTPLLPPPRASAGGDSTKLAPSIAVLPFLDVSPAGDNQYFIDGLTEEIGSLLAAVPGLRVAARTSAFSVREQTSDPLALGRALRVQTLLEGSVRKAGHRLSISVSLVNAEDGLCLWRGKYDRDGGDIFAVQEEIGTAVVRALRGHLTEESLPAAVARRSTPDVEAYNLYLKGRYFWYQRTGDALQRAGELFRRAVERDPSFALAHAGLGDVHALLGSMDYGVLKPRDAFPIAIAAIERALELDPGLAVARAVRANVKLMYQWDWPAAEEEFRQALQLDPACVYALHWYGLGLAMAGRSEEALTAIFKARELDPLSPILTAAAGRACYFSRDPATAIAEFKGSVEMKPSFVLGHVGLGLSLLQLGEPRQALEAFECANALAESGQSLVDALMAHAWALLGKEDEARATLDDLRTRSAQLYIPAEHLALVHLALGETSLALEALELAAANRSGFIPMLGVEPLLDPLRGDPRFSALVERNVV